MLGIPTSVEKYEILEEIGRGGMATVYRARDLRLDRLVALKVMHPHLQGAKEARARFAREARTVARLRHPGLLEIFDYSGEDSELSFIATELLTGPTLRRLAELQPEIPAEMAACMALQVARALTAAHAAGVIHRDVKPENIMVHEGRLKLTDFGIAQLIDAQGMTTTGQVLGSPGHMAPEQVEGKDCTAASDIFALGTVLYLLATGELPFSGRNPHQVLKQIVDGEFRDPLLVRPAVGTTLGDIICRCLAVDPLDRYATADALCEALQAFLGEMQVEDPDGLLREYLAAPERMTGPFVARIVARLSELGDAAMAEGSHPRALAYWNRALSLDERNEKVLLAVQGLSRRARRVRMLSILGAGVATLSLLGLAILFLPPFRAFAPAADAAPMPPMGGLQSVPPVGGAQSGFSSGSSPRGGTGPAVDDDGGVADLADEQKPPAERRPVRPSPPRPDPSNPRVVVFNPSPANVSIAVDGGPARAYGPSFRSAKLRPGEHTFMFAGAHECCIDETFTIDVPAGAEPFALTRQLAFRPAGLYVVTDAPANVLVDGNIAGRSRSILQVPHSDGLLESHTLVVTAPGYEPHEQQVQLQAGQVSTVEITLSAR